MGSQDKAQFRIVYMSRDRLGILHSRIPFLIESTHYGDSYACSVKFEKKKRIQTDSEMKNKNKFS